MVRLTMNESPVAIFRSDITPFLRMCAKFCAFSAVLFLLAAVVGQWRVDRFPVYFDLLLAAAIPFGLLLVLWLFGKLVALVFPVKIFQNGLRCYDGTCRYRTIAWDRIHSVYEVNLFGLRYLLVEGDDLSRPLTVPLWLENMPKFRTEVEKLAGKDNSLVRALYEAP